MNSMEESFAALETRMKTHSARAAERAFKPQKETPTSRADITDRAAREIIEAETSKRAETTARLRAQRLAREGKTE